MTKVKPPDCPDCLKKREIIVMRNAGSGLIGKSYGPQWRFPKCKRRTIVNKEVK